MIRGSQQNAAQPMKSPGGEKVMTWLRTFKRERAAGREGLGGSPHAARNAALCFGA